jgi:bZIP factor
MESDISHNRGIQHSQPSSHRQPSAHIESPVQPSPSTSSRPSRQDSTDNLKTFKVSLDDPTWKVLPAALKKYKINNDNWQNYAMFICYGSPGQ